MGAPGEGQSRPTQPPPRRLQLVMADLPSCDNNWNETQQIPKKQPTFYPNSTFNFCLQPIILPIYSQLQLFPTRKVLPFHRKALLRQSTAERKKERKGERKIKYCCMIPFISFARFRLHLNRLNKLKNFLH